MSVCRSTWTSVRDRTSQELHAVGGRLLYQSFDAQEDGSLPGLSDGQEALLDQILLELVYRSARKRRWCDRCTCELCTPEDPF